MGRGRISSEPSEVAGRLRSEGAGRAEEGSARGADAHAAIRRLSVHPGKRGLPHPRHQWHHRPPHRLRHQPRRLECGRQCACAHHVGHGHAAGRHDLRRVHLLALHGQLGGACRRRAPAGAGLSIRCRRIRHVGALRAVARPGQAAGLLRHTDLRVASRQRRA